MPGRSGIAALNHLLAQNEWARQRLARFSDKTAHIKLPPLTLACTIQQDGTLRQAAQDANPDSICTLSPALLARLALGDESALDQVQSSGDSALIEEMFFLARNLRWDAAEDLSRVTGDIAAERIVQFAGEVRQRTGDAVARVAEALAEYWTEERPLLAKPEQVGSFAREVSTLLDAMDALEQRIQQIPKAE